MRDPIDKGLAGSPPNQQVYMGVSSCRPAPRGTACAKDMRRVMQAWRQDAAHLLTYSGMGMHWGM